MPSNSQASGGDAATVLRFRAAKKSSDAANATGVDAATGGSKGPATNSGTFKNRIVKASRMPQLPQKHRKITMRPRGGLHLSKVSTTAIGTAVIEASGLMAEQASEDVVCPNFTQNIVVVSTPEPDHAARYVRISTPAPSIFDRNPGLPHRTPTEISPPSPECDPVHLDTSFRQVDPFYVFYGRPTSRGRRRGHSGKTGGRPRTTTATVADTQVGYDPHSMIWTTVPSSDNRPELPQPFKSAALAAAVARREQANNAVTAASANAVSPAAAADAEARTCSSILAPPAPRSAGPQQGKKRPLWQPKPLPKPKATHFVVVLKPRTQFSLATICPENGAGRGLIAHLSATATRLVTVVMVQEQNLILTYTSNPQIADKLIGEFAVPSPVGPLPLFGYLRADMQDFCYGVVTVRSSDTEATLRESFYCPEG
ncbi:hypothetical protein HPB49_016800 [Dermacentor silvarum]|uniref:Uncharacterized protein n=1 Tax=Dermacentor silvarum TaxID=543639 RepID=A0ACB8CSA9_DERSI|nr:hypothetical protein HPB49_016800 [Dermacentor silvarum]